jgi:hypothetical protein
VRHQWFNVTVGLLGGRLRPGGGQSRNLTGPADDDAIVTTLYRTYRDPLMTFVLRLTAGDKQHARMSFRRR